MSVQATRAKALATGVQACARPGGRDPSIAGAAQAMAYAYRCVCAASVHALPHLRRGAG